MKTLTEKDKDIIAVLIIRSLDNSNNEEQAKLRVLLNKLVPEDPAPLDRFLREDLYGAIRYELYQQAGEELEVSFNRAKHERIKLAEEQISGLNQITFEEYRDYGVKNNWI